mgnify:CR=1 FL=1
MVNTCLLDIKSYLYGSIFGLLAIDQTDLQTLKIFLLFFSLFFGGCNNLMQSFCNQTSSSPRRYSSLVFCTLWWTNKALRKVVCNHDLKPFSVTPPLLPKANQRVSAKRLPNSRQDLIRIQFKLLRIINQNKSRYKGRLLP